MLGRLSLLATDLWDSFVRIAYLDCSTGISGDMTLAALIDAGADFQQIRRGVDSLGIPGVRLEVDTVVKGGFRAQQIHIEHPEQHAHRHLSDIRQLIDEAGQITAAQKELATRISVLYSGNIFASAFSGLIAAVAGCCFVMLVQYVSPAQLDVGFSLMLGLVQTPGTPGLVLII